MVPPHFTLKVNGSFNFSVLPCKSRAACFAVFMFMLLNHTWKELASDFYQAAVSLCLRSLPSNGKRSRWLTVGARLWAKHSSVCWLTENNYAAVCVHSQGNSEKLCSDWWPPILNHYWNPRSAPPRARLASSIFRCGPNFNWHIFFFCWNLGLFLE